nr:TonB-dependent receptor [Brevundimonas sp.]
MDEPGPLAGRYALDAHRLIETPSNNDEPIMDGPRQVGRRYPDYALLDVGANWRVRDDVTLKFGVYNLTDKVLDVATYDFQGDGRRYWMGVSWDF